MKIALLTPSRDGRAHLDHSEAVADARIDALRRGLDLVRYRGKGSANLPRNRNLLTAKALKDGADVLAFVDCDIAFTPSDLFVLANSECDIVAALPQKRTHKWGEVGSVAGVGVERSPDATGFHVAVSVPTAFMIVKRRVFEKLRDEGFAKPFRSIGGHDSLNGWLHNWFFYQLRESETFPGELEDDAEDYYFCRKWRAIGGLVHAAPDVRLKHFEGLVEHSLTLGDIWRAQDQQAA